MPATPIVIPGWIYAVIHGTQFGTDRENTLSYNYGVHAPPSVPDLTQIGADLVATLRSFYLPILSNTCTLDYVEVTDRGSGAGSSVIVPFPAGSVGTVGGDPLPGNVSAAGQWKTSRPGRSYRGRFEAFGLAEGHTVGNVLTNSYVTGLLNLMAALKVYTGPSGLTLFLSVASRLLHVLTTINTITADAYSDSQRTRLQLKGR
jgi:hypothetical protein